MPSTIKVFNQPLNKKKGILKIKNKTLAIIDKFWKEFHLIVLLEGFWKQRDFEIDSTFFLSWCYS